MACVSVEESPTVPAELVPSDVIPVSAVPSVGVGLTVLVPSLEAAGGEVSLVSVAASVAGAASPAMSDGALVSGVRSSVAVVVSIAEAAASGVEAPVGGASVVAGTFVSGITRGAGNISAAGVSTVVETPIVG